MILLTLFIAFLLVLSPSSEAISVSLGTPAPGFSLSSIDGKAGTLSAYKGNVVVLIYWKTGHERSLMALRDAQEELGKFEKKGVKMISIIAGDDSRDDAAAVIRDNGITFPVFVDSDRQLYSSYGIRVYPTTVIIDKEGIIAQDLPSHAPSYRNSLDGYIRKTLGDIDDKQLDELLNPHREDQDRTMLEAQRLYNLSLKFAQSGQLDQAIDTAKRSVEAKPDLGQSHILLGFLYLSDKDGDRALAEFNRALEIEPHSHDAQTGLGGALVLKGETDRAIEVLTNSATANPYPQAAYYELGRAYEQKGDKDKAIEMYRKAMEKIIKKQVLPSAISRCQ